MNRPASSLELPTKLDRAVVPNEVESSWLLNLYPDAAEAGGCLLIAPRPWNGRYPFARDPDRVSVEAIRRARGHVRRYCAANRLNRLGTLTYAGVGLHDPVALRSDVGRFFRSLRRELCERFPYLWAPEWHPEGHGLHVHFAVGRYVPYLSIRRGWGHGYVHIKLLGNLPVGSGTLGEACLAARYLSKYVAKDLGAAEAGGLHRYEVAQGFGPKVQRLRGATANEVLAKASTIMGRDPEKVWDSAEERDWDGPHAIWASWSFAARPGGRPSVAGTQLCGPGRAGQDRRPPDHRQGRDAPRSGIPPECLDALGIEGRSPPNRGPHDRPIEHGRDDRALSIEGQGRPCRPELRGPTDVGVDRRRARQAAELPAGGVDPGLDNVAGNPPL